MSCYKCHVSTFQNTSVVGSIPIVEKCHTCMILTTPFWQYIGTHLVRTSDIRTLLHYLLSQILYLCVFRPLNRDTPLVRTLSSVQSAQITEVPLYQVWFFPSCSYLIRCVWHSVGEHQNKCSSQESQLELRMTCAKSPPVHTHRYC